MLAVSSDAEHGIPRAGREAGLEIAAVTMQETMDDEVQLRL